jgi:hypothetical protein
VRSFLHALCLAIPAVGAISTVAISAGADADKPLTPADVVSVMSARRVAIRKKCYEESPVKADAMIKVDFTIAPAGIVTDVSTKEASGPPSIIECVAAEVRRTVFPASSGGGRFRWPFLFKGP